MPTWSQHKVQLLRRMAQKDDVSAADITTELRRHGMSITRNAVLGKLHRLGISIGKGRGRPVSATVAAPQPTSPPPRPPRSLQMWKPRLRVQAQPSLPRSDKEHVMFEGQGGCRWPIGTDMQAADYFCGAEREYGYPYCLQHCCMAYQDFGRSQKGLPTLKRLEAGLA